MFVMISPLQTHLSETLTSLKFATKVDDCAFVKGFEIDQLLGTQYSYRHSEKANENLIPLAFCEY